MEEKFLYAIIVFTELPYDSSRDGLLRNHGILCKFKPSNSNIEPDNCNCRYVIETILDNSKEKELFDSRSITIGNSPSHNGKIFYKRLHIIDPSFLRGLIALGKQIKVNYPEYQLCIIDANNDDEARIIYQLNLMED